ncbi:Nop14-like protein [Hymenopellis radicata]|nr:Nop14-like protein [Hymenopellis radicata]
MAKGSQLSQLKSALSQAGITGKPHGTKRKRSNSVQGNDKAKRESKLAEINQKLNPFDTKVTKLKHDVGGRKLKGVTGKPAQSKMAGLEQRKKTLLKEYQEKDRAGGIVDRRFGENDPSMSLEDRMLERFTRERQRASKGVAFNLEDEDELTHYGQSLSKMDDFDDVGMVLDEEEDDDAQGRRILNSSQIAREIVQKTHFGGFDDDEEDEESEEPPRKKSKAEVMAEVMAKSKEHKLMRQMDREKEDAVRHELDDEFASLRDLIFAPVASTSAIAKDDVPINETTALDPLKDLVVQNADYDQHVRELAFDKRAKPKDRTKTEEELAREEKEALEKAEHKRQKRMQGLDDSDSEDEGKLRKGKRRRGEADDLDDDFVDADEEEGWAGIGTGLGETSASGALAGSSDEDDEDGEGDSDEDDDGEESDDDEEAGDISEQEELTAAQSKKPKKTKPPVTKELPFTFDCPSTHEEFLEVIAGIDDSDVPTVLERIRKLHHTSLAPENKFKLQALTGVLIDHILYLCSLPVPQVNDVSALLPHLLALTKAYPVQSAEFFVRKLTLMHKNLNRGLSKGALNHEAKTWPRLPELTLLRITGVTWSTSDLNHAVVSPARVLMGAYLGLARIRSHSDIASGLFVTSLFLQYEKLSKRLIPEAVNFLVNTVLHLAPTDYKDATSLPGSFPSPDFKSETCKTLTVDSKSAAPEKVDLLEYAKAGLLRIALDLLGRYADLYKALEGFIELFEPIAAILKHISKQKKLHETLQTKLSSVQDTLKRLLKFSRQARKPLALQAHKPIPIPTYIPKFESTSSSYLRHQDPDHERNEAAKLRNQYKKEKKGAIRELRKDAKFLASVQQEKQKEKDKQYLESMRKVYGTIEGERAEEKGMEREKAKEKRRAGRK